MRVSSAVWRWLKALIIGSTLVVLSACSLVRVSYDNGPALLTWRLDGYLDLDDAQEAAVRAGLSDWFAWHRASALPQYAAWLAQWRSRAAGDVTADELCRWSDQVRDRLWQDIDRALPAAARLLPGIAPAQWEHLAKELAERLADERAERVSPSAGDRRRVALERTVERAETLYGAIDEAQRRLLADAVAASPMDAARWLDDRAERQRRFLAAVREAQRQPEPDRRLAALRGAVRMLWESADPAFAALQARWQQQGCVTSARLHATTTPAQRRHLQDQLADWERDLRALAAAGAS